MKLSLNRIVQFHFTFTTFIRIPHLLIAPQTCNSDIPSPQSYSCTAPRYKIRTTVLAHPAFQGFWKPNPKSHPYSSGKKHIPVTSFWILFKLLIRKVEKTIYTLHCKILDKGFLFFSSACHCDLPTYYRFLFDIAKELQPLYPDFYPAQAF